MTDNFMIQSYNGIVYNIGWDKRDNRDNRDLRDNRDS